MGERWTDMEVEVIRALQEALGEDYPNITPDTALVTDFTGDEEELAHFLDRLASRFGVQHPSVENMGKYMSSLWSARGFHLSDLHRYLTRRPEIDVRQLTVRELCKILERREWPRKLIFPPSFQAD